LPSPTTSPRARPDAVVARGRRRAGATPLAVTGAACGLLVLGASAGAADAAPLASGPGGASPAEILSARIAMARFAIAAAALGVWVARGHMPARAWRAALALLAVAAFASNFDFFLRQALHRHELYHYYLGAKYFPELGYARLYECSVEALRERGLAVARAPVEMTDLRTKRRLPAAEVLAAAPPCRPDFEEARWQAFQEDVARFRALLGDAGWLGVLRDHGYNPSPVWTLIGRPIASHVPATPASLWLIARLDLVLLLALFAAIRWAFGFEATCLAAVAWGACGHTAPIWTGNAFLRQLWFATAIGGLCLVRRGRHAAGGALVALATGLRVFPGAFLIGYGMTEARRAAAQRRLAPGVARFVTGVVAAGLLLAVAATVVAGRGVAAWSEFARNTAAMTSFTARNTLGLTYLLGFDPRPPPQDVIDTARSVPEAIELHKRRTLASRRWLQVVALAAFGLLFWRATRPGGDARRVRLADWEGLAAGALLIPVLTLPASYYVGFVVVGALLATRRPRVGLALLLTVVGFAASVAAYGSDRLAYVWSSAIVLAYCAWALHELARPPAPGDRDRRALSDAAGPAILRGRGPG
jgi:hypothetical protein